MDHIPLHEHVCKNCGNTFTEQFCNRCGQKAAHRITLAHVFHDLVHVFLHADKGVFSFIQRLIIYPGILAKEFIEGKRRIFNPFQYLILVVGFMVFLMSTSGYYESIMKGAMADGAASSARLQKGMGAFMEFIRKNTNLISFLTLPIYALFSWLFFKKRGNNYAEHFTIQVFAQSWITSVNLLFILAFVLTNSLVFAKVWITIILAIIGNALVYRQFYKVSWIKALVKSIGIYTTSFFIQVFIMILCLLFYILVVMKNAH